MENPKTSEVHHGMQYYSTERNRLSVKKKSALSLFRSGKPSRSSTAADVHINTAISTNSVSTLKKLFPTKRQIIIAGNTIRMLNAKVILALNI